MSTLLHPNCPDNPCVDCSDCWIIESGCYIKWFCVASTVQVFGPNGSLRSTDPAGQIFRPSYGLWELWACNGIGCTPRLVATVEVGQWQEADCESNCCTNKDFVRYQVGTTLNYNLVTEVTDRDNRFLSPGIGLLGEFIELARLEETIEFDFSGSYLWEVSQEDCFSAPPVKVGESVLRSEGTVRGTISTASGDCPIEIDTLYQLPVDIYFGGGGIFYFTQRAQGSWQSVWQGYDPISQQCAGFAAQGTIEEAGLIEFGRPAEDLIPCSDSSVLRWGVRDYGYFIGQYVTPTSTPSIIQYFQESPSYPAAPSPYYNSGSISLDFI